MVVRKKEKAIVNKPGNKTKILNRTDLKDERKKGKQKIKLQ